MVRSSKTIMTKKLKRKILSRPSMSTSTASFLPLVLLSFTTATTRRGRSPFTLPSSTSRLPTASCLPSCSSRCTVCSACRPTSRSAIVITMSLNVTPVISSLKGGRLICLMCGDLFYPSRFIGFGSSDKKYSTYHTSLPSFSLDFILKRVKASLSKPR